MNIENIQTFIEEYKVDEMSDKKAKEVCKKVVKDIKYHNQLYYIKASPVVSDFEYDKLFDYLKKIEEKFPKLVSSDSPTQNIAVNIQSKFEKTKHKVKLLSLENSYNAEDLKDWDEFVNKHLEKKFETDEIDKKILPNLSYIMELKLDWSSVELVYKYWELYEAITRWDWIVGENITENVKTIHTVPMKIEWAKNIDELRVRWEIVMPKSALEKTNKEREKEWLPVFVNTRNATAGSLRQLDTSITAQRWLVCCIYEILYMKVWDDKYFLSERQKLQTLFQILQENKLNDADNNTHISDNIVLNLLEKFGFYVVEKIKVAKNIAEVIKSCKNKAYEKKMARQNIEYDWIVVKVNELLFRGMLGTTGHHPRWAIAYKFPAQQLVTKVLSVDFQIWRTWTLTPVANLEPLALGGVTIRRATMHNFDFVKEKDIHIWDYVWIQRSGEVIPYIVNIVKDRRDEKVIKEILPPEKCPVCQGKIINIEEEVSYKCSNINCSAQLKERLKHFVSKDAINIDWLWDKIIDVLVDTKIVKHFADIYILQSKEITFKLRSFPGFGTKKLWEMISSINKSKNMPLYRWIYALGIQYVWLQAARLITKNYEQYLAENNIPLSDLNTLIWYLQNKEILLEIKWIWSKTIDNIVIYLWVKENIDILKELESNWIWFCIFENKKSGGILQEQQIAITWSFDCPRTHIIKLLEKNWAIINKQISSKTTLLLVWQDPSSKLKKAQESDIKTMWFTDFLDKYPTLKNDIEKIKPVKKTMIQESLF